MANRTDLTAGSIGGTLLRFALPFLGARFLQVLYGAVDLFVVGHFCGTSAISAVNIGTQIMGMVTSGIIGCAMGSTVLIGQQIGRKNNRGTALAFGNTVSLFLLVAALLTPLMVWAAAPAARLMNTPAEAMAETNQYLFICSLGIPFIVAFNALSAVFRGLGDSRTPLTIVAAACLFNVVGDLVLGGLLQMGVAGVAIATVSAQALSSLIGAFLLRGKLPFSIDRTLFPLRADSAGRILQTGLPIAVQDVLIDIAFLILTVIANGRGLIASSAVGVTEKIINIFFLVPSAMLSSVSAITAQNVGAGKMDRVWRTMVCGMVFTSGYGCVVCLASWLFTDSLTGIFTADPAVIALAGTYLRSYSIDCILVGINFCANGALCGLGRSMVPFVHNIISVFTMRIPLAWVLSRAYPGTLFPMGLACPLGSLLSTFILAGYALYCRRKKNTFP